MWKAVAQAFRAKMVTVLITSFLLIAAISYAIYCRQRPSSNANAERALPPPPPARGLFNDLDSAVAADVARLAELETANKASALRAALLRRAAQADRSALSDARGDEALYEEVLGTLVERADDYKKLFALVSYIKRSDGLRVNVKLAERFLDAWRAAPDGRATAVVLHLAATADNAPLYQRAVEAVYGFWRDGQLPNISTEELRTLFDGEYWVLSAGVRNSGAGFILKQKLAKLRLELLKASSKSL
jgi:hypothetical protein